MNNPTPLLPCPFCGRDPVIIPNEYAKSEADVEHVITCNTVECPVFGTYTPKSEWWNRRALSRSTTEAGSEYDKAIEALAPYLPDGWVACNENGSHAFFEDDSPEIVEPNGGWFGYWQSVTTRGNHSVLNLPPATDWRTSLRRIRSGAVSGKEGSET